VCRTRSKREESRGEMEKLNLIVKVKNATEGDVRKALKTAGIDIRSIAVVYREDERPNEKDEGSDPDVAPSKHVS
jgi:hypothetical protein